MVTVRLRRLIFFAIVTLASTKSITKEKMATAFTDKDGGEKSTIEHTNVVEENPTLDVGPLIVVRVGSGTIASLPCDTHPLYPNDSVTLVLWYNDDTTKPFLSYDARQHSVTRRDMETSFKRSRNKIAGSDSVSQSPGSESKRILSVSNYHMRKQRSLDQFFDEHRKKHLKKRKRETATVYKRQRLKWSTSALENKSHILDVRYSDTENKSEYSNGIKGRGSLSEGREHRKHNRRRRHFSKSPNNSIRHYQSDSQLKRPSPPYSSFLPFSSVSRMDKENFRKTRVTLNENGGSLHIESVQKSDQTEYRCTVHYRKSPSVTNRLRLEVQKRVRGMLLLDDSGMVAGKETGPHSEGHRLSITCKAAFDGELSLLEWSVGGELLPSSWSQPRASEVVSHLELQLLPEYDQKFLTCRIITKASSEKRMKIKDTKVSKTHDRQYSSQLKDYFVDIQSVLPDQSQPEFDEFENSDIDSERSERNTDDFYPGKIEMVHNIFSQNKNYSTVNNYISNSFELGHKNRRKHKHHHHRLDKTATKHRKHKHKVNWKWESTITDVSLLINMFSIPRTELRVLDDKGVTGMQGGVNFEVAEGGEVTLECRVSAKPPPYNITFMLYGEIVSSPKLDQRPVKVDTIQFKKRWREGDIIEHRGFSNSGASLLVSPVKREAEGLYTCLASNTEGDGHSNALMIRVRHAPYCQSPVHRRMIVSRNSSTTLFCPVDANPKVTSYTWIKIPNGSSVKSPRPKYEHLGRSLGNSPSLLISPNMFHISNTDQNFIKHHNKVHRVAKKPQFNDRPSKISSKSSFEIPTDKDESQDLIGIVCYAKNSQGYSIQPCLFSVKVVDPPSPPRNCSVSVLSSTRLAVNCLENTEDVDTISGTPNPEISYVRSPHTKARTTMEVWSSVGLLVVNMTSVHPSFDVRGLPPSSDLQLRLYSSSPEHLVSVPVVLHAQTPKWTAIDSEARVTFPTDYVDPKPSASTRLEDSNHIGTSPPYQHFHPVQTYSPRDNNEASFSTSIVEKDSFDGLNIFIIVGSTILLLGTVFCLGIGVFLLCRTRINSSHQSSSKSDRSSEAKYSTNDQNSIMLMKIEEDEQDGECLHVGTTFSDNETADDEITDEALHLTENHCAGSDFSLIENSPVFVHSGFLSKDNSLDILKDSFIHRVGSAVRVRSSQEVLNTVIDDTFSEPELVGRSLGSQQDIRKPAFYSFAKEAGREHQWGTLPPQIHKMVTFSVPSDKTEKECKDNSATNVML